MAQDIGVAYVHVEPSGQGFGKSIEGSINDAVGKASKKSSSNLMSKLGGAFGKIGKAGTATIAGLATGITVLAAKGGFERALNIENAKAKLTGLGHDSQSVTEIMNDALASVKGTAFGLGDAATVAASLSASGVAEGTQLTEVLKTVADTAQISGRSLTDIGTIFGSVAARGKLQGDDMLQLMSSGIPVLQMLGKHLGKTSSEISDMVSDGKIDFQTFADAMKEGLGGAAQSAGDTFTGALANVKAALSRLGESAATPLLNGLRGLFNQAIPLIDSFTSTVKPTLEKVGASLQSGLENAIPTIQAKLKSLGDTIGSIPGLQMLASAAVSLKAQLEGLAGALISLASGLNAGGRASAACSTLVSALGGTLASMTQALSNTVGWVKEFVNRLAASGSLQPFLESLLNIATSLAGLASALTQTVQHMLGFDNSASTASDMAQRFSTVLDTLAGVIRPVGEWIRRLGQWAQSNGALIATALKTIAVAFLAMKGWQAIASGVQAVTGGLKAVTTMAGGITRTATAVSDLINGISDAGSMAGALSKLAGSFSIVKTAQAAWSAVTKAATAVQLAFNLALQANPIGVIVTLIAAIAAALTLFFTKTKIGQQLWASFTAFLTSAWQSAVGMVTSVGQGIVTFLTSTVPSAIQSAGQWFQQLPANIASWLAGAVAAVASWAAGLGQSAMQAGQQFLTNLANAIMNLPATIAYWLGYTITSITLYAAAFATQAVQMGSQFLTNIGTFLIQLPGRVAGWLASAISSVSAWASGMAAQASQTGSRFLTNIGTFLAQLPGRVGSWLSNTIAKAGDFASQMGSKAMQAARQFASNIVQGLASLPGRMVSIGANIVNGIINGIRNSIGQIGSTLMSGVNDAIASVKSKLGIKSPSRLMRDEVGVMIGRGLALGIDDSNAIVSRSMDSLIAGMTLDDADWSKNGRMTVATGVTAAGGSDGMAMLIAAVESLHADLGPTISRYAPSISDRDFARKVRNAIS